MTTKIISRIWVHSDLQLAEPEAAQKTLTAAVDDVLSLDQKPDAVWCLGDAQCGRNEDALREVAHINVAQLRRLDAPVYYVMGNHEMDLTNSGKWQYPLRQAGKEAGWHMAEVDGFYFTATIDQFLVVFMGDHASPQDGWWTSHGTTQAGDYPYSQESYEKLRALMRSHNGPVIIASHYAFPGGQRPADLMGRLLPLPANVLLHMHGHAHIGDMVWNKENPWKRDNPIEGDSRLQFNISALESRRSPGSHSAMLELYADGTAALRIRCHLEKAWKEEFFIGGK